MNSGNSFTALALSVFTAASASVAILSSFRSGAGEDLPIAVSGPEALRRELRAAQAESLPSSVPLTVDAGWRVYTGDEGGNAAALAEGLLPAESPDGGTGWPVFGVIGGISGGIVGSVSGFFFGATATEKIHDWIFTPLEKEEWEIACEK